MLTARDVAHRFAPDRPWVLDGVGLALRPGEIVGLDGPSGTGKSTLARILAGWIRPARGHVALDGRPLPDRGPCPVQLVHQSPELAVDPRWTAGRLIAEGAPPPSDLLDAFAVRTDWLDRRPVELSGGELQRIALVRALIPTTRYLIADEPTAMLDPPTQAGIWHALLAHARPRGLAILAIGHDRALLDRVADRVVRLADLTRAANGF
jgi:peptide/nickel transport system ATP-binding protein